MLEAPEIQPARPIAAVWSLRALLGALLLVGTELLLWIDPTERTLFDGVVMLIGYLMLATLLLDVMARYRVRTFYETMAAVALMALCAAGLINPRVALFPFPDALMTRVLGGFALIGLEMLGLWMILLDGRRWRWRMWLYGYSVWLGFYWGVWVRWTPSLTFWLDAEVPLMTMFSYALAGLVMILIALGLVWALRHQPVGPADLKMSLTEWSVFGAICAALFFLRTAQGEIDIVAILGIGVLMAVALAVLYYQRTTTGRTILDYCLPVTRPLAVYWLIPAVGLFSGAAVLAYGLPLFDFDGFTQLLLMEWGFALVGGLWLPGIAAAVGIRAYDRMARSLEV